MKLNQIMQRFSEGLVAVDAKTTHVSFNQRTGEAYLPGVKTMNEPKFVEELVEWWIHKYPKDFDPELAIKREVPYENIARATCDLILSTDGSALSDPEWAIEIKHIALVGNNGKNNDFGIAKILSPYLKDRSLVHDIKRLKKFGKGKKKAVIGYSFDYSYSSCEEALSRHLDKVDFINNVKEVCKKNDPKDGEYSVIPLVEFADGIFTTKNLVRPMELVQFKGAWRHPCGGDGTIFGWELN
jgi:hypothetical protein